MTLNQLIKKATAFSRKYTTGDIPLMIYGTEVDITLTEHDDNGHLCIEMNCVPTPKEKTQEIKWQAVTPMGSDCTQGYVVLGAEGMKVRDFIAYCCDKYKSEHGYFSIMSAEDSDTYGTLMRFCYGNGSINAKSVADENFEKTMNLIINNIKANGGWSAMDYDIYCKTNYKE
jgi:hypothetical protein